MCCCNISMKALAVTAVIVAAMWSHFRLLPQIERCLPFLEPPMLWNYGREQIPDLTGKTAVVTGANKGLGLATSKLLLQKGATVVMGCRNMKACEAAKATLQDDIPDMQRALPLRIDLASLNSVANFATTVKEQITHLDILVLNAAVFPLTYSQANDTNLDVAFSVNHVGHFLLTTDLVDHFAETGPIKVAVVSSSHHFITYDDPIGRGTLTNPQEFEANAAYGYSKLANILFVQEYTQRLHYHRISNVFINAVHPGGVRTDLLQGAQVMLEEHVGIPVWFSSSIMDFVQGLGLFSPDAAAITVLYPVTSPEIEAHNYRGEYFVPVGHVGKKSRYATNVTAQHELWDFTNDLLDGLGYGKVEI